MSPMTRRLDGRCVAYGAALWALLFGALHVAWAAGWYVGLDAGEARVAFARPAFLAYDLVAALLCAIAVPVARSLASPPGPRARGLLFLGTAGASLLVLRSAAGLCQAAFGVATGQTEAAAVGWVEPWFLLGAVLFIDSARRFARTVGGPAESESAARE